MFELIREHQLNLMLLLCGSSGILVLLLLNTRFLSKSRMRILILMEAMAFFLLWFDRLAYVYSGDVSPKGYFMLKLSNFIVFFLTPGLVLGLNLYITEILMNEKKLDKAPLLLRIPAWLSVFGMGMAVISAFTDLYYYFDEAGHYQRGPGFLIAYIIPVICPLLQFAVLIRYRKAFSRLIFISILLYIFVPIICGIIQIFTYGISIVNMAMVAVSISMYIFMYLDMNDELVHVHEAEIRNMQGETDRMQRLFGQTATAFVSAVEKKDDFTKGNAIRVADYAKRIASLAGKSEEECEKVYYAALLHDVGLIGVPDSVIKNDTDPNKRDYEVMRQKPLIGAEILSSITEYPYLCQGARYSHERYNGTGYPEGLKGEEIPEIARIIGVADAYVTMTTRKRYRDALPEFMARESFITGAGEQFDPYFAQLMVQIMDTETNERADSDKRELEKELTCNEYRDHVSAGIPVENNIRKISFDCELSDKGDVSFSAPSVILFDSYDGRFHNSVKEIDRYVYLEYGEVWFDKHSVTTAARNIVERERDDRITEKGPGGLKHYEIIAGRVEDHFKLIMRSEDYSKDVIVALPSGSKASYIGLTGENCRITNIVSEISEDVSAFGYIPRIAEPVSYIEHFESDIKNIQIDQTRSATTVGVEVKNRLTLGFHTASLPGASLVWHCPYILLYSSNDGIVGGQGYMELNLIKLDGEDQGDSDAAKSRFVMKKTKDFPGWDAWKEANKAGINCEVLIVRKGNQITLKTENLGIRIENTLTLVDEQMKVYAAVTGDQVALTDISVK